MSTIGLSALVNGVRQVTAREIVQGHGASFGSLLPMLPFDEADMIDDAPFAVAALKLVHITTAENCILIFRDIVTRETVEDHIVRAFEIAGIRARGKGRG